MCVFGHNRTLPVFACAHFVIIALFPFFACAHLVGISGPTEVVLTELMAVLFLNHSVAIHSKMGRRDGARRGGGGVGVGGVGN